MTVFVKSKDGKRFFGRTKFPFATWLGVCPVLSSFTGVARIINATRVIFKELSQIECKKNDPHLCECWTGFKNLFRGLVEIVPIIGNVT